MITMGWHDEQHHDMMMDDDEEMMMHHHHHGREQQVGCGFVFAFFRYSHMRESGVLETLVHYALRSDCIHVAILAAPHVEVDAETDEQGRNVIHRIVVHDITFTAFVGYGYEEEGAASVMNENYEYVFMPVSREGYDAGLRLLFSLQGLGYNYMGLPFTMLPTSWKKNRRSRRQAYHYIKNNNHHNNKNEDEPKKTQPAAAPTTQRDNDNNNNDNSNNCGPSCAPSRVFCSQVGLMLCYTSNALDQQKGIDPGTCSPGELSQIILKSAGGVKCPGGLIEIENDDELLFAAHQQHV